MIVPIIDEAVWLEELRDLPVYDTGDEPLVVVSPHPDDETLAAGGLIAAHAASGRDVLIIAVTDGENAYSDCDGLGEVRVKEQDDAVNTLGAGAVRTVRLGLVDSGVNASELAPLLRQYITAGSHVVAPWVGDYHPDHEACGRAAMEVAEEAGARLSWYLFWTWHRGTPADLRKIALERFPLSDALMKRKRTALQCHRSQLKHASGEPILPDNLLAPAFRNFEVFAPSC